MVLDTESFYRRQGFASEISDELKFQRSRQIKSTADGFFGHSGSPFLNENGEVLGIFVEYLAVWEPSPANNTSYGPHFSYIFEVLDSL